VITAAKIEKSKRAIKKTGEKYSAKEQELSCARKRRATGRDKYGPKYAYSKTQRQHIIVYFR